MRGAMLVVALAAAGLAAQEQPQLRDRYNIAFNPIIYPQKSPQESLKSVVRALDADRYDYLLAHLADPKFVDTRVAEYLTVLYAKELLQKEENEIAREADPLKAKQLRIKKDERDRARFVVAFNRMVSETRKHFAEDPVLRRELRLMARDAEWEGDDEKQVGTLKKVTNRKVTFRKREERWFMEERQQ